MAISVLGIPTSMPKMAIRHQYLHVVVVLGNARTVRRRALVTAACV